jgi:succinate dehydrogenase/fumarate reductase flavoprotein subunit
VVGTPNDYRWSADNLAEVRHGWITRAASPAELAERLGLDPAVLTATLTKFNTAAAAGRDDRFGRRAEYMAPLDPADLYAIELWPAVATTSGGPRRDACSRVVRPDGTPVPGLYAAGGVGTVWGPFTHSGGGLTDALVFGRLAGRPQLEHQLRTRNLPAIFPSRGGGIPRLSRWIRARRWITRPMTPPDNREARINHGNGARVA